MAKIKKHLFNFKVRGHFEHIESIIEYNNGKFFIEVPPEMVPDVEMMKDKWDDMGISTTKVRGRNFKYVIFSNTENTLIDKAIKTLQYLREMQTTTRDVIVVHFDDFGGSVPFASSLTADKKFIGYTISYVYCKELSASGGFSKRYLRDSLRGEEKVSIGHSLKGVIIPDTPENRATIEAIYNASESLLAKLSELCKSEDKFLEFSANRTPLLTQ